MDFSHLKCMEYINKCQYVPVNLPGLNKFNLRNKIFQVFLINSLN